MQEISTKCDICKRLSKAAITLRVGERIHDLCLPCKDKLDALLKDTGREVPSSWSLMGYSDMSGSSYLQGQTGIAQYGGTIAMPASATFQWPDEWYGKTKPTAKEKETSGVTG